MLANGITEVGEEREKAHENDPELCQAFVMSWHQGPGEDSDTYLIEPPLALLITVLHCMSPCLAVAFKVSEHDNTQKKKIVGRPGNGDLK